MRPIERAGYIAHSRTNGFIRRVEYAESVVQEALRIVVNPYVAYSGGKDSACLLHLVLQQKPNVSVRILTSGETRLLYRDLDAVLEWWGERFKDIDLLEVNIDRVFSEDWQNVDWNTQRLAGRGDIVRLLPASGDFDGVFMGLRDEESNARRMANKRGLIRQYSASRGDNTASMYAICPLAYWTLKDVGAYICLHDLPILAEYERAGLEARTTARLTGDAIRHNSLQSLRLRDLDGYNKLISRFPEISWWNG